MVVLVPASAAELLDLFAVTLRDSLSSSALCAIAEEYGVPLPGSLPLPYLAMATLVAITGALCLTQYCTRRRRRRRRKTQLTVVELVDNNQWTRLFNLAKTSHVRENKQKLMESIQTCGIDVNGHRDPATGLTLLLCACLGGDKETVKFLLAKGADYTATTAQGDSALLLATYACCTVKTADSRLLDLLACRGINVNAQNSSGNSALSIAALHGRTLLISMLLQYGADPYIPNLSGILPVDFAGSSGNFEAAKLLENHMKQARPHD